MITLENEDEVVLLQEENKEISLIKENDKIFVLKKFYNHGYQNVYTKIMQNPHKNICEIFRIERLDNGFAIKEEYLGEQTLLDISPIKDTEEGYRILFQLCDAVKHLHKLGIVHRDLKPENIYYIDGRVIVNDFDISKMIVKKRGISQDTEVLGSAGYAPPEQYGFSRCDERADIYSIGIIINVLFSGYFISEHLVEGRLGDVVRKCTQIHMGDRYQNIASLEKDLHIAQLNKSKYALPGFRTNNKKLKIFSAIGYFIILCLLVTITSEDKSLSSTIITKIIGFEIFLLPVLIGGNYLNIKSLLPWQLRNIKFLGSFVLWMFIFVVVTLAATMITSFL